MVEKQWVEGSLPYHARPWYGARFSCAAGRSGPSVLRLQLCMSGSGGPLRQTMVTLHGANGSSRRPGPRRRDTCAKRRGERCLEHDMTRASLCEDSSSVSTRAMMMTESPVRPDMATYARGVFRRGEGPGRRSSRRPWPGGSQWAGSLGPSPHTHH